MMKLGFRLACVVLALELGSAPGKTMGQERSEIPPISKTAKVVPSVQAIPLPDEQVSFVIDGVEVTRLHYGLQHRRPFLYPVQAQQGVSLTRMGHPHAAFDHSHHNSIWMSHADIQGVNFWADQGDGIGRIELKELQQKSLQDGEGDGNSATFSAKFNWAYQSQVLLEELRTLKVVSLDGTKSWLLIWTSEFSLPQVKDSKRDPLDEHGSKIEPLEEVNINATAFGMLAVRMAKSIGVHDGGGRILNSERQVNEQEVFRKPAKWCDYTGRITNGEDGFGGITIMNSPSNPSHPTPFHVRNDGWMGACLSMDKPIAIKRGEPLKVTYGLWVHGWDASYGEIEQTWQIFQDALADR